MKLRSLGTNSPARNVVQSVDQSTDNHLTIRILFDFGSSSVYAFREICNGEHFDGHYGHISNAK
jgi:hypothetical protein